MGKKLDLLEKIAKSDKFTLKISGVDEEQALVVLKSTTQAEDIQISKLLLADTISIMSKPDKSDEPKTLLALFESFDPRIMRPISKNPTKTIKRKGKTIIEKTKHLCPSVFRANQCKTLLEVLFDRCGYALYSQVKSERGRKTSHFFNFLPGSTSKHSPFSLAQLTLWVKDAFNTYDCESILFDLFTELMEDPQNFLHFFERPDMLLGIGPTLPILSQLKILESCMFYLWSDNIDKPRYKGLHEVFNTVLAGYNNENSTQIASSRHRTSTVLSMSEASRAGALKLIGTEYIAEEQQAIIAKRPILNRYYQMFISYLTTRPETLNNPTTPPSNDEIEGSPPPPYRR